MLFIPGLVLWWLNGMWLSFIVGILSARFRDVPQIVANFVQILFLFLRYCGARTACRIRFGSFRDFNPLSHFLAIVRNPLLGSDVPMLSWVVVMVITITGWITAAFLYPVVSGARLLLDISSMTWICGRKRHDRYSGNR